MQSQQRQPIDIFDKPGTWQKLLLRGLFDTLYTTTSTVLFSIFLLGGGRGYSI